jgi:hypothetical protein
MVACDRFESCKISGIPESYATAGRALLKVASLRPAVMCHCLSSTTLALYDCGHSYFNTFKNTMIVTNTFHLHWHLALQPACDPQACAT